MVRWYADLIENFPLESGIHIFLSGRKGGAR